jgi:hypothetical protein
VTPAFEDPSGWRPLLRVSSTLWLGELLEDEGTLWVGDDSGPRRQVDLDVLVWCLPLRGACGWLEETDGSEHVAAWARRIEDAAGASQSTMHRARRHRRSGERSAAG